MTCLANNKIYCVASGGLFFIEKEEETINRISKVTGLSDVEVNQVAYDENLDITIIVYDNCNIDLLKHGQVINISDIKRKEITGLKFITNISSGGKDWLRILFRHLFKSLHLLCVTTTAIIFL